MALVEKEEITAAGPVDQLAPEAKNSRRVRTEIYGSGTGLKDKRKPKVELKPEK